MAVFVLSPRKRENRYRALGHVPAMAIEEEVREKASELRIDLLGFGPVERTMYREIVMDRMRRGLIPARMEDGSECFRNPELYSDGRYSLPEAKTLISVGGPYFEERPIPKDMSFRAAIARHFWRDSYTDLARKRDGLVEFLRSRGYKAERAMVHPREAARITGLTWIGRNALAINPTYGSWVLYFALVTDAKLEPTPKTDKDCPAGCRKCIEACPTRALVEPYVLDVNKCLNYITESRWPVPYWAMELLGNRINGCDVCQEVCPMNKRAKPAPQPMTARKPDPELVPYPLIERLFSVDGREMEENYGYMDWDEPSTRFLKRNALVAAGNSGERDLLRFARQYAVSRDEMLREPARWAVDKLSGKARKG